MLGMSLVTLPEAEREQYDIPSDAMGALVIAVEPGSGAESKGIVPGDVILELHGEPIGSAADLVSRMELRRSAGNLSMLLLVRNARGESRFAGLTFPEQEQGAAAALVEPQAALIEEHIADPPASQTPEASSPGNGMHLGVEIQDVTLELAESLGLPKSPGWSLFMSSQKARVACSNRNRRRAVGVWRQANQDYAPSRGAGGGNYTLRDGRGDGSARPASVFRWMSCSSLTRQLSAHHATGGAPPDPPENVPSNPAITTAGFDTAGIRSISVTLEVAEAFGMTDTTGAIVAEITEGSPADSAGIEIGDLMLEFDGQAIQNSCSPRRAVRSNRSRPDRRGELDASRRSHHAQSRIGGAYGGPGSGEPQHARGGFRIARALNAADCPPRTQRPPRSCKRQSALAKRRNTKPCGQPQNMGDAESQFVLAR